MTARKIHFGTPTSFLSPLGISVAVLISLPLPGIRGGLQGFLRDQKIETSGKSPRGGRDTLVGMLMRAERRRNAEITEPFPPSGPTFPPGASVGQARNRWVLAEKGSILLVLHFSVMQDRCAPVDRERLVVKDEAGKSYSYGGWGVEQGQYNYCSSLGSKIETGPWGNILWTPIVIRPELGFVDLVYQIKPDATGLRFSDGINVIELDPLLKPQGKNK